MNGCPRQNPAYRPTHHIHLRENIPSYAGKIFFAAPILISYIKIEVYVFVIPVFESLASFLALRTLYPFIPFPCKNKEISACVGVILWNIVALKWVKSIVKWDKKVGSMTREQGQKVYKPG